MITITVDTRQAVVTNREMLTSGSVGIQAQFTFSEDWDGLTRTAVFRFGDDENTKVDVVLTAENICTVPWEVLQDEGEPVFCGVYGMNSAGSIVIPTIWASIGVVKPGVESAAAASPPPTPSDIEQVKSMAMDAVTTSEAAMSIVNQELGELHTMEDTFQMHEVARVEAENNRIAAETARTEAEQLRVTAEDSRANAEYTRIENEVARGNNETARVEAENARATAETARATAETARASAETARAAAEAGRVTAEQGRVSAEAARVEAEEARVAGEQDRLDQMDAAVEDCEAAQAAAEAAQASAEAADTSATGAAAVSTAQAAIAVAKAEAAADSAAAALLSEGTATSAANVASTKAGEASTSATSAATSANTASTKAGEASTSAATASTKASEAAASATAAAASETAAAASETNAALSETNAGAAADAAEAAQAIAETAASLVAHKAPLITDTATGDGIVSFSDGAGDMPLALTCSFKPIQDLGGQEAPWPPGGGVNKFNQITEEARLDPDGSVVSAARLLTDYIPVVAGETYAVHVPYSARGRGAFYDSGKNLLSYYGDFPVSNTPAVFPRDGAIFQTTDGYYFTFIAPSGASYVRYNIVTNYGTTYNNDISFNYPSSVTTYSPYSNICPISGHTGCEINRTGKNLLDDSIKNYSNKNVVFGGPTSHTTGTSCSLKAGTYTLSVVTADGTVTNLYVKDATTGANISGFPAYDALSKTFTLSEDTSLRVYCYKSTYTSASDITHAQINIGSTASDYEPYRGTSKDIAFGETVYGCTLTVFEDGSGQIVATKAYSLLNDQSLWYVPQSTSANFAYDVVFSDAKNTGDSYSAIICSYVPVVYGAEPYGRWLGATNHKFGIKWESGTLADIKQAASDGKIAICYELATPVTIPLTASTPVTALKGINHVWVDAATGEIIVDYPCDTKLYIDKKIAEMLNQ